METTKLVAAATVCLGLLSCDSKKAATGSKTGGNIELETGASTPSDVNLTSKGVRIIRFNEYSSGASTAFKHINVYGAGQDSKVLTISMDQHNEIVGITWRNEQDAAKEIFQSFVITKDGKIEKAAE